MNPYVVFLIYMVAILSLVAMMLIMNRMLGPKPADTAVKLEAFECGATPVEPRNVKAVPAKYYAVAIVFILFDLETVFIGRRWTHDDLSVEIFDNLIGFRQGPEFLKAHANTGAYFVSRNHWSVSHRLNSIIA